MSHLFASFSPWPPGVTAVLMCNRLRRTINFPVDGSSFSNSMAARNCTSCRKMNTWSKVLKLKWQVCVVIIGEKQIDLKNHVSATVQFRFIFHTLFIFCAKHTN